MNNFTDSNEIVLYYRSTVFVTTIIFIVMMFTSFMLMLTAKTVSGSFWGKNHVHDIPTMFRSTYDKYHGQYGIQVFTGKKNYFKNFTHLCCAPFPFFSNAVMF